MTEPAYLKILEHLEAAARIVRAHQGSLSDGDIRLRHLLSISTTEARRQLQTVRNVPPVADPFSVLG